MAHRMRALSVLLLLALAQSGYASQTSRALLQRRPSPRPAARPPPSLRPSPPPSPQEERANNNALAYDDVASFNYGMGTQQFNPQYGFQPGKSALVEGMERVLEMGSNAYKFNMDMTKYMNNPRVANGIDFGAPTTTLTQIVSQHPAMVEVLNSDLKFFFIWTYTRANMPLQKMFEAFEANTTALNIEYRQIYDLTAYLLTRYRDTGKAFYLGNWEADWHLLDNKDLTLKHPRAPNGMIDWYNTRTRAIEDAKRDLAGVVKGVEVYHYIELNQPRLAMGNPRAPCVVNSVLPFINPDFVSYSSYDSLTRNENPWGGNFRATVQFLQSRMRGKTLTNLLNPGRPAPYASRVFIGEYGFFQGPVSNAFSPQLAAQRTQALARIAFQLNLPFMFYWQVYNNEITASGAHRGWWLIDDRNRPQPVFYLHQQFLTQSRAYVTQFKRQNGRVPTAQEYNANAVRLLNSISV